MKYVTSQFFLVVNCPPLDEISNGNPISYDLTVLSNGLYSIGTEATYSCSRANSSPWKLDRRVAKSFPALAACPSPCRSVMYLPPWRPEHWTLRSG